jgi:cell division protein ZapA (FtsZ GTPase activity inhibitor)
MDIFERLSCDFDLDREVQNIWNIFSTRKLIGVPPEAQYYLPSTPKNYTILEYVGKNCFSNWKSRRTCVSCEDMMNRLGIKEIISEKKYLEQPDSLITLLEFIANMYYLCDVSLKNQIVYSWLSETEIFCSNLSELTDRCSYEMKYFPEMERIIIVEKNALANYAASIVDSNAAERIIEYNHLLYKGNIESKRDVLLTLANKIESQRSKLKEINREIETNVFFLLNNINIRHENVAPDSKNYKEYVANMGQKELEEWYDDTYYLALISLALLDNVERNKRIDELKKKITGDRAAS